MPLQCKSNETKKAYLTKDSSSLDGIYKMYLRIFLIDSDHHHHHRHRRRHHHHYHYYHHHHYHQHHTLDLKDDISGVCTDQSTYDNDVSVSEEEFY